MNLNYNEKLILIKPGEIALKGLNRNRFENLLVNNIKKALNNCGNFNILAYQSVFIVQSRDYTSKIEEAYNKVKNVFGISKLSLVYVCEKNLEKIKQCCVKLLKECKDFKSFKVEARRADKSFKPNSKELCPLIGDFVLKNFPHTFVDMHPELCLKIEIRHLGAYIYANEEFGLGGLPIGCCGTASVLLSGGIDSPVAAYMMAKRGMHINCIHFLSPPYTSELAKQKVQVLVNKLEKYCGEIIFKCVNLTKIQETIKKSCPEDLFTIILRRFMLRIAQDLAVQNNENALITGESLGQVASQTCEAIICTNEVCKLPIMRPLIGMDKAEIIAKAKEIGTFETSILPYEDCCTIFTPKHPRTSPKLSQVIKAETKLLNVILNEKTGCVFSEAYKVETLSHLTTKTGGSSVR